MTSLTVRQAGWHDWPQLASVWERVHSLSSQSSFFLSREWVDCWLAIYGEQLQPELLTFLRRDEVVGCCLLVSRTEHVRGIPLRRVYLNCAGEDEADATAIEFNGLLALPGCEEAVAAELAALLKQHRWDELMLSGMIDQDSISSLASALGEVETTDIPARYVPFAPLRETGRDYMSSLSPKKRKCIRWTQRSFEETGGSAVTVDIARDPEEGIAMLRQLADLHQVRWTGRGAPGCFSSDRFTRFHNRLICNCFDRVMLFRVQAGSEVAGLLYCFVFQGWVYHYQSGIAYSPDKRRSPGLLTLYHVISACLAREDLHGFDFMAGDSEYKRSLTSESDFKRLRWHTVRRRTPRTLLYLLLRSAKRRYVEAFTKGRERVQPPDGSEQDEHVPVPAGQLR